MMLVRHLTAVCFCVSEAKLLPALYHIVMIQCRLVFTAEHVSKHAALFEISELCFIPPRFLLVHNETCRYFKLA